MNDCKMCEGNGQFYDLEGQIWRCYCRTTDNERLERIKERVNYHGHLDDDIEWLIQQAERVVELEKRINKDYQYAKNELSPKIIELEQQNKHYREAMYNALIALADDRNTDYDTVDVAIQFLEEELEGEE